MTPEEQKEQKAIDYLSGQIDFSQPEVVLRIYRQILEQDLFSTDVGKNYVLSLRQFLIDSPAIDNALIPGAPSAKVIEDASKSTALPAGKVVLNEERTVDDELRRIKSETRQLIKKYKNRMRTAMIISVISVVMVIAMFVITLTSNLPTIINYRRVITDQYEQWEQELSEREADLDAYEERVREMARKLGKDGTDSEGGMDTSDLAPIDDKLFELKDSDE